MKEHTEEHNVKEQLDANTRSQIKNFGKILNDNNDFLLVSHHDADGVASCAIIIDLLKFLGKNYEFKILRQLDSAIIKTISAESKSKCKSVIFTDMGSGQIELISENFSDKKIFIIDHHLPQQEYLKTEIEIKTENLKIEHVNPHIFGIDGAFEVSGSGMCYFVARELGRKNLVDIAIVGAVGDMQDSSGKLIGVNREILKDGIKEGVIKFKKDIRLFGRESRPLPYMLAYATDPFIPNISGSENSAADFLLSLGIKPRNNDGWVNYVDLKFEERQKLISALYVRFLNVSPYAAKSLVGEVYTLLKEKKRTLLRDAKEFATLLNSCGRQKIPEIGIHICLGDRDEMFKNALSVLEAHRLMIRRGIEYLKINGLKESKKFYYFDAKGAIDENVVGIIAGMSYSSLNLNRDKFIVGLADDSEDSTMKKVSARANLDIVKKGVNLGDLMREGCWIVGGEGGGHSIAAGARIPKEGVGKFLEILGGVEI